MKTWIRSLILSLSVLLLAGAFISPVSADSGKRSTPQIRAAGSSHTGYFHGYDDGTVRPEGNITRAETCYILYNLLDYKPSDAKALLDVDKNAWYAAAVSLMASYDIIDCPAQKARPNDPITRGELVLALCRLVRSDPPKVMAYKDIQQDSVYYEAVGKAAGFGWINGYDDGTFRPDNPVTRAEAAKILNRVTGRIPDKYWIDGNIKKAVFKDLNSSHWAYYELMEAVVAHEAKYFEDSEIWDSASSVPVYQPEPQPQPQPQPEPEPQPEPQPEPEPKPQPQLQPSISFVFDGNELYAVNEKGETLKNTTVGKHLYFGWDGRYTCGDATVDTYVKNILSAIVTSGMSRDEKLKTAYYYVRDNFYYRRRNYYDVGATGWELAEARTMYETYKGNCYNYTAALTMIARQLGYDAEAISGLVGSDYQSHGWVEITIDGVALIFDTTLESSYVARGYNYSFYKLPYAKVPWPYVK